MTRPIRVLLVDDHDIVREGLRQVLQADGGFDVVGEAGNAVRAMEVALRERPDVVLLDITMPGESGLVVLQRLRSQLPDSRVLVLSVHDDAEYVMESVRAGAHGYLRKDTTPADLRSAVRAVHAGDAYFSPVVARRITEMLRTGTATPSAAPSPSLSSPSLPSPSLPSPSLPSPSLPSPDVLTNREREVLTLIARGLLNKEIGVQLGISVRTVEAHRDSVTRKLGIRSAAGLTRFAMTHGLLSDSDPTVERGKG